MNGSINYLKMSRWNWCKYTSDWNDVVNCGGNCSIHFIKCKDVKELYLVSTISLPINRNHEWSTEIECANTDFQIEFKLLTKINELEIMLNSFILTKCNLQLLFTERDLTKSYNHFKLITDERFNNLIKFILKTVLNTHNNTLSYYLNDIHIATVNIRRATSFVRPAIYTTDDNITITLINCN